MFKIKLKTKNGNDVKHKVTFTCFFSIHVKTNVFTKESTRQYTYRILGPDNLVADSKCVLEMKDKYLSKEDFIAKIVCNLNSIVTKISQKKNVNPDVIMYISPYLDGKLKRYMNYMAHGQKVPIPEKKAICEEAKNALVGFAKLNENTKLVYIDPEVDSVRYEKSLKIIDYLDKRFEQG